MRLSGVCLGLLSPLHPRMRNSTDRSFVDAFTTRNPFFFFFWKGPHPSFLFPSVFLSFESAQNRRETAGSEPLPVATADDSWRAKWRRRARDLSCCHPSAGAFQRRDHRPALLVRVDSLAGQVTCSQERPRPDGGSGRPAARRLTA